MTSRNVTYDDRDTDRLTYVGGWFKGTYNASATGDSGTLASTDDTAANVTFVFPTPATAFYYYGIPRCCGGSYQICVDCDKNNMQWQSIDAVNKTDGGTNPPMVLYSKTFSSPGIHEIILTNRPDDRFQGKSQITVDKFVLQVDGGADTSSSASIPQNSSVGQGHLSSAGAQNNTPAIVGAVFGVLAFLIMVISVSWWRFVKRRRRPKPINVESADPRTVSHVFSTRARTAPVSAVSSAAPLRPDSQHFRSPSSTTDSYCFPTFPSTVHSTVFTETDAGPLVVANRTSTLPTTLPPQYAMVFNREDPPPGAHIRSESETTSSEKQFLHSRRSS